MKLQYFMTDTTAGPLGVALRDGRVYFSMLSPTDAAFVESCQRKTGTCPVLATEPEMQAQIAARVSGSASIPFDLDSCTEFQRAVLQAVSAIPRGEVRTYAQIAEAVGRPRAARAVGEVMRTNPVPVLIPCHRVIRSDASPGNYSPRPEIKRQFLSEEGAL